MKTLSRLVSFALVALLGAAAAAQPAAQPAADPAKRFADDAARFDAELKANPKNVDAAYDAGQAYYNLGKFDVALARWQTAKQLTPDDFEVQKKILQALHALGRTAEIGAAHDEAIALWKRSKDPETRKLTELVFDQFKVGAASVMAVEMLEPKGDLYDVMAFKVGSGGKLVAILHLESSAYGRETGVPLVLGVETPAGRKTTKHMWKAMPPYADLKKLVQQIVREDLGIK